MIVNIKDVEVTVVEGLRGGEGKVYLKKVNPTLSNMKMYATITIPKGSSIGIHTHEVDEEVIYCLKNKGVIIVDGKESEFNEGMIAPYKKVIDKYNKKN